MEAKKLKTDDGNVTPTKQDLLRNDSEPGKSSEDGDDSVIERRTSKRLQKLKEIKKSDRETLDKVSSFTKKRKFFENEESEADVDDPDEVGEEDLNKDRNLESLNLEGNTDEPVPADVKASLLNVGEKRSVQESSSGNTNIKFDKEYQDTGVQIKKYVRERSDGKIEVITTYQGHEDKDGDDSVSVSSLPFSKVTRTYPGLKSKVIRSGLPVPDGKKYVVLDKDTLKGMIQKGLIQSAIKEGANPQNVSYHKSALPKSNSSSLQGIPSSSALGKHNFANLTGKTVGTSHGKESVTLPTAATSVPTKSPPGTVPTSALLSSGISINKSKVIGTSLNDEKMQIVSLPSSVFSQIQNSRSILSRPAIISSTVATNSSTVATNTSPVLKTSSVTKTAKNSVNLDEAIGDNGSAPSTYGVPTGVCKVLKSMKMYQYVEQSDKEESGTSSQGKTTGTPSVRWVAVPNGIKDSSKKHSVQNSSVLPVEVKDSNHKTISGVIKDSNFQSVPTTGKEVNNSVKSTSQRNLRKYMNELKLQHARLIGKHRTRYSRLQKKYFELERDFKEVEDVGTPHQIVRDSKRFLSEEHALFMESQLFLKNEEGKGNRYSKRFLQLMLALYSKTPAGYKYLKTVFTLPSIKFLLKLKSQGFGSEVIDYEEVGQTSEEPGSKCSDINSSYEHPLSDIIKSEEPVLTNKDSVEIPPDSKDWFKSGILAESLPSTSDDPVFLDNSSKGLPLHQKREEDEDMDVEEEEIDPESSHHSNPENLEIGDVDSSITSFNNISKKVVVMSGEKQEISIQWDEAWNSI